MAQEADIVIVGGGICGLATALALHRKGIESIVLERSETLRATGSGITIHTNGWRALDHLGVASVLRKTAVTLQSMKRVSVHDGKHIRFPYGDGELRCLKRTDLIEALASNLPHDTIKFRSQVQSINFDSTTSNPILQLHDGSTIKAKVVIGCDGVKSTVADNFELNPIRVFSKCTTRGFTSYPNGHGLENAFVVFHSSDAQLGQIPITDNLVYWYLVRDWNSSQDSVISREPTLIKESALESLKRGFPIGAVEMVKRSELDSLRLTKLKYRAPWDIITGNFRKGTVVLAGDAMHAMCPFIAQGGSAALEDAVVLATCLSEKMSRTVSSRVDLEKALGQFVEERKRRVFWLSLQTYLMGMMNHSRSSIARLLSIVLLMMLFRDRFGHTRYDCGHL